MKKSQTKDSKMKKQLMTITNFIRKYGSEYTPENITKEFPPQKTNNGICFKLNIKNLDEIDPKTIVYVSEFAYEGRTDEIYTVEDIKNILLIYSNGESLKKPIKQCVKNIFQIANWQKIEILADEYISGMEDKPQDQSIDSKIATLQAYKRGKTIEIFDYNHPEDGWNAVAYPKFNFDSFAYRAARK